MKTLLIKSFGMLRFEDAAGCEPRAQTRKTAALAIYLAMHPEKRFSRDALAGLLWGDKEDSSARHSLSQAISDLRRTFGDRLLGVDPQFLWSPSGAVEIDALRLSRLAQGQGAKESLELIERLYEGDFLEGFELRQEEFDCWVMAEREGLRQLALRSMTELLAIRMRCSEFTAALGTAHKILKLEPFEEAAHRAIMRCYFQQGFTRRASEHFKTLTAALRRELGVAPETATTELYKEILHGPAQSSKGRTLSDYAFVLEQLPYAVVVTDTANRIVGWNRVAEETLGFSKEEMFGRSPTVVYAPDHDSTLADQILRKAMAGGRWMGEVALTAKDGSVRLQRRVVTPLFGREGEFVGAFGHGYVV